MVSIDEFKKIEIRVGEIMAVEKVPDTDKLLRLTVNLGEAVPRTIVSGIALHYPDSAKLVGLKCAFVANLEPRMLRGIESQGMILAGNDGNGVFSLLLADSALAPGTLIG